MIRDNSISVLLKTPKALYKGIPERSSYTKMHLKKIPVVKLAFVMERHLKKVTGLGKRSLNFTAISSSLSPSLSIGATAVLSSSSVWGYLSSNKTFRGPKTGVL